MCFLPSLNILNSAKFVDTSMQDVSNRFVREAINKKILRLLALHHTKVPCILVLNKMDTIPRSRRVYDLIRKLTCNRLDGVEGQLNIKQEGRKTLENYLKTKAAESEDEKHETLRNIEIIQSMVKRQRIIESKRLNEESVPDDVLEKAHRRLTEEDVSALTSGLVGWPGFRDVFSVSALTGEGVADLRQYLLDTAAPGKWRFPANMKFDEDPRDIVVKIIKSKLLEHLPNAVPYGLTPVISIWDVDPSWDKMNIVAEVHAINKNIHKLLIGPKGSTAKKIAQDTQTALMDFFSHEVQFKFIAVPLFEVDDNKSKRQQPVTMKPNIVI